MKLLGGNPMDDDRNWLKNPILPRPPAVPRFSAAELRLVEDQPLPLPSVVRAVRKERSSRIQSRRRLSSASRASSLPSITAQSRRIAG